MRCYHNAFSSNSRRALMTAIHLDVKLDLVVVNLQKGEQRSPDMLRLNPNGKVPVLEDDGFLLWESHAIMQYLAGLALAAPLMTVVPAKLPVTGYPNLLAWFGRVQELDAWKKTSL